MADNGRVSHRVEIERVAAESLVRIARGDRVSARRIDAAIRGLAEEPRPVGAVKLTGLDAMRLRVGNYRVIYVVDDTVAIVSVTKIGHRREVYER